MIAVLLVILARTATWLAERDAAEPMPQHSFGQIPFWRNELAYEVTTYAIIQSFVDADKQRRTTDPLNLLGELDDLCGARIVAIISSSPTAQPRTERRAIVPATDSVEECTVDPARSGRSLGPCAIENRLLRSVDEVSRGGGHRYFRLLSVFCEARSYRESRGAEKTTGMHDSNSNSMGGWSGARRTGPQRRPDPSPRMILNRAACKTKLRRYSWLKLPDSLDGLLACCVPAFRKHGSIKSLTQGRTAENDGSK